MIYNFYEIAKIYNVTRQHIQAKYKDFKKQVEASKSNLQEIIKDGRTALKPPDLKEFIEFLKYDFEVLKKYHEESKSNYKQPEESEVIPLLKQQLQGKDEQIKELHRLLAMTQKNLNDIIQDHKKIKYDNLKKAELINKFDEEQKNLQKLYDKIDQVKLKKKAKDDAARVREEFKRMREAGLITTPDK